MAQVECSPSVLCSIKKGVDIESCHEYMKKTHMHMHTISHISKEDYLERYTSNIVMAAGSGWEREYTHPWGYFNSFLACAW